MSDQQPSDVTAALSVPFPQAAIQVKQVPGQRPLSYVAGHTYIHRLIDATSNVWDWQIKSFDPRPYGETAGKNGQPGNARLLLIVTGTLTIPGLGSRDGMGVQVVTAETGGEDMWKGAQTDAIKAAAKLFGVGLELYGPDYESGDAPPAVPQGRPPSAPAPASNESPDEIRKRATAAVFAAGGEKRLVPDDVKFIAYRMYRTDSMTKLSIDQLRDYWRHIDSNDAETLLEAARQAHEHVKQPPDNAPPPDEGETLFGRAP